MPKSRPKDKIPDPPDQDEDPGEDSNLSTLRELLRRAAALREKAAKELREAETLERAADELKAIREGRVEGGHRGEGLSERPQGSKVGTTMEMRETHAAAIAKGQIERLKKKGRSIDPLTLMALASGYAGFRGLARELGVGQSMLWKYRSGSKIPRTLAKKIERLTGFEATPVNWPGGFKDE